ncbi:MAG: integrase arm-type DNA-binding domain-containing protein [Nitrospinae bacterium]|nr:integrase arm-type DNA-binding domain-containing protein [Nitrospinota bacterium]
MIITERKIKYLEAGKSRQIVWDNGGFGIQVAPDGEKSFVLEYRFNEMTKMITLGIYPEMSLETAKQQAVKAFEMIIQGVDPEEKGLPAPGESQAKPSTSQRQTLDQIREKATQQLGKLKEKASETLADIKTSETFGKIKEKASETLADIKTSETFGKIKEKASETLADIKTSETLGKIKGKAAAKLGEIRERIEKKVKQAGRKPSPEEVVQQAEKKVIPIKREAEPPAPEKDDKPLALKAQFGRILDRSELKTLWSGLANSDMPPAHQLSVKLLMVTAQRYEEVEPSRWADFDMVSKWWTIPGDFTRNGKKHRVPLTNLALDLLRKIKELSGMSGVLFPVPDSVTPTDPKTLASDLQKAQLRFGLKPFTIEDLQNSVVCQMIDNGIEERILYPLLNQDPPEGLPDSDKKITDRDLRSALEKLEKQLPKSY